MNTLAPVIRVEMTQPTHVVKLGANVGGHPSHWPACQVPEGTLVDLRLFIMDSESLGYLPEELAKAGVPEHYIKSAAESNPPGFVLIVAPDGGVS